MTMFRACTGRKGSQVVSSRLPAVEERPKKEQLCRNCLNKKPRSANRNRMLHTGDEQDTGRMPQSRRKRGFVSTSLCFASCTPYITVQMYGGLRRYVKYQVVAFGSKGRISYRCSGGLQGEREGNIEQGKSWMGSGRIWPAPTAESFTLQFPFRHEGSINLGAAIANASQRPPRRHDARDSTRGATKESALNGT
jgi:hypothetical protein